MSDGLPSEFLEERGVHLVNFIERFHATTGTMPDRATMMEFLTQHGYSFDGLDKLLRSELFTRSMTSRGLLLEVMSSKGHLTPRQIATAAVMTNLSDRRSDEKKLRDLGVSTTEWETWKLDTNFMEYLNARVERILGNSISDAHLGLVRSAKSGNVPAIKLLYEITNRYNPEQQNNLNIQLILARIVEIVQKYVKDPEILQGMGTELTQLAIEAGRDGIHQHSAT